MNKLFSGYFTGGTMNGFVNFFYFLSAAGSAVASDNMIGKTVFDIITVVILAVVLIVLTAVFIYKKKNRK